MTPLTALARDHGIPLGGRQPLRTRLWRRLWGADVPQMPGYRPTWREAITGHLRPSAAFAHHGRDFSAGFAQGLGSLPDCVRLLSGVMGVRDIKVAQDELHGVFTVRFRSWPLFSRACIASVIRGRIEPRLPSFVVLRVEP